MSCTIYAYQGNVNAQKTQIAALYGGITVEMAKDFKMGVDNKTPEFLKWNPNGQVPTMMTPEGPIWESNAMARYVARKGSDKGLFGNNDYEASQVDQWLEWFRSKIEPQAGPLVAPIFGWMEYNAATHDKAKDEVKKALTILNTFLDGKKHLVANRVTLADIVLCVGIYRLFTLIMPLNEMSVFPHVVSWFQNLVAQPHFKTVLGEMKYCEKEAEPGSLKRH